MPNIFSQCKIRYSAILFHCIVQSCNFNPDEIAFWPMVDQVQNLLNLSQTFITSKISFEATATSHVNVLNFKGVKDSYVLMSNHGQLAVTSFTWMCYLYPEALQKGPIFHWHAENAPLPGYHGTHIWYTGNSVLLHVCRADLPLDSTRRMTSDQPAPINQWNTIGVSFDAVTGLARMYINGVEEMKVMSLTGLHSTSGPGVMGSRDQISDKLTDNRA